MAKEEVNARKVSYGEDDAVAMADKANELYVCRGKKVVQFNLKKDKPDRDTLVKLMIGPTGNLRAPTLRIGKTLVVGFNEDTYRKLLA